MRKNNINRLLPLGVVNIGNLLGFGIYYLMHLNYEFIIYLAVVLVAIIGVVVSFRWVRYPSLVLWGLTAWAVMHMAGGAIYIGEVRLYELILLPLSDKLPVFRYDQLVHILGYGVSTMACYCLIEPVVAGKSKGFIFWFVVAMAGLGVGAVNEILEFFVTLVVPESGVGDYVNTSLDLIADAIGATIAVVYMSWKR